MRTYPHVKAWLAKLAADAHLDVSDVVRQIIMARYEAWRLDNRIENQGRVKQEVQS